MKATKKQQVIIIFFPYRGEPTVLCMDAELQVPVEGQRHTISASPATTTDVGLHLTASSDLYTHGGERPLQE